MAMAVGGTEAGAPISDINTTPLIDVMLVLLIMLIISIPPVRQAVTLDSPQAAPTSEVASIEPVRIGVDFDGAVSWNGEVVAREDWDGRMSIEARRSPQPEIHIEPHRLADYGTVAAVMASAQRNGLERMGVVGGT